MLEYCNKSLGVNNQSVVCNTVRHMIDVIADALPEDLKLEALYQTTQGMAYLHQNNIVHCELKSQNVLITSEGSGAYEWVFKVWEMLV